MTLLGEILEAVSPAGVPGADTVGWMRVTVAEACLVGSAAETAVTVTAGALGMAAGAAYTPAVDIRPSVELPPVTPPTCQVTAVLLELVTVAVKACVPVPTSTFADVGVTLRLDRLCDSATAAAGTAAAATATAAITAATTTAGGHRQHQ